MTANTEPKVLFWDIETGFNKAAIFGLGKRWVPYTAVLQERYIICVAYKWKGDSRVNAISIADHNSFNIDPSNDYNVVKAVYDVLCKADAIVAHYGDAFDIKFFNGRLLYYGLPPLPNIKQIDTYKIAKNKFMLNSYKLDYLGTYLGLGKKIKTDEGLWHGCLNGDRASVDEMVRYNKQDVILLEKVFDRISPYAPSKLNAQLFFGPSTCKLCGSEDVIKKGREYLVGNTYQAYMCKSCGHRFRDTTKLGGKV